MVKPVVENQTTNLYVGCRSVFSTENGIACEGRHTLLHMEGSALSLLTSELQADWHIDMDAVAAARTKRIGGNALDFMNTRKTEMKTERAATWLTPEESAFEIADRSCLWSGGSSL